MLQDTKEIFFSEINVCETNSFRLMVKQRKDFLDKIWYSIIEYFTSSIEEYREQINSAKYYDLVREKVIVKRNL